MHVLNNTPTPAAPPHPHSEGCGAFYNILVESPDFVGKSLVAQHRLVKGALKKEIGEIHGLTLQTRTPNTEAPVAHLLLKVVSR